MRQARGQHLLRNLHHHDHQPPHFHAEYGDDEEGIIISSLAVYAGNLPRTAHCLVIAWGTPHQEGIIISSLAVYAGNLPRTAHCLVIAWGTPHQEELAAL